MLFIEKIIDKIKKINIRIDISVKFGNKTDTTIYNCPQLDKKQLKMSLLTSFSDKKSYKREEIADKISKLLYE